MEKQISKIEYGCIADDFTGAADIASFFKKGGLRTVLYNGVPDVDAVVKADAIVIALKTRTQEVATAVADSMNALGWLVGKGARHLYIKYCSTFDSTPKGNIGPIVDAAMEQHNVKYTILCPALPVNGRTVENGVLYVNGIPLSESHMKDHPLTPMRESHISNLMQPQSKYSCLMLTRDDMALTANEVQSIINKYGADKEHFYIIPDFSDEVDAARIVELFGSLRILTGGSGIAERLGALVNNEISLNRSFEGVYGKAIILAGSCSSATLRQISRFQADGGYSIKLLYAELLSGKQTAEKVFSAISAKDEPVLVFSSDTAEHIKTSQQSGMERVSELLECTTAAIAQMAVEAGYTRIIVAGGETSGAVIKKLGYCGYEIGENVSPGVPVMMPIEDQRIRMILKPGNFGDDSFFRKALDITHGRNEGGEKRDRTGKQ
ncbi:MAG: four-carbon acid sugar kinase family protein [Oscillospiraceae bacterium]